MHYLMLLLAVSVSQIYAMKPFLQMIDTKQYCQLPVIVAEGDQFEASSGLFEASSGLNVVGSKEQRILSPGYFGDIERIGDMKYFPEREVRLKNAVFEKYFDRSYGFQKKGARIIVEGVPFIVTDLSSYMKDAKISRVITVREPSLERICTYTSGTKKAQYQYYERRSNGSKYFYTNIEAYGNHALVEAEKDLRHCYREVLFKAYEYFTPEHKSRTLSLPVLSALLGFPQGMAERIAVEELLDFARSNECEKRYNMIYLFVSNVMAFKNHVNELCTQHNFDLKESYSGRAQELETKKYGLIADAVEETGKPFFFCSCGICMKMGGNFNIFETKEQGTGESLIVCSSDACHSNDYTIAEDNFDRFKERKNLYNEIHENWEQQKEKRNNDPLNCVGALGQG